MLGPTRVCALASEARTLTLPATLRARVASRSKFRVNLPLDEEIAERHPTDVDAERHRENVGDGNSYTAPVAP